MTTPNPIQAYNNSIQNVTVKQFNLSSGPSNVSLYQNTTTPYTLSNIQLTMAKALGLFSITQGTFANSFNNNIFAYLVSGLGGGSGISEGNLVAHDTSPTFDSSSTWDSFLTGILGPSFPQSIRDLDGPALLNAFTDAYIVQLQSSAGGNFGENPVTVGGELTIAGITYSYSQLQDQFIAMFNHFIQNYPGTQPVTADDFFKNWLEYTTTSTTIFANTPIIENLAGNLGTGGGTVNTIPGVQQLSYEQIYFAHNPPDPLGAAPTQPTPNDSSAYTITGPNGNPLNVATLLYGNGTLIAGPGTAFYGTGQSVNGIARTVWEQQTGTAVPTAPSGYFSFLTNYSNAVASYQSDLAAYNAGTTTIPPDPNDPKYNVSISLSDYFNQGGIYPFPPGVDFGSGAVVINAALAYTSGQQDGAAAWSNTLQLSDHNIGAYLTYQNAFFAAESSYTTAINNYTAALTAYNNQPAPIPPYPIAPTITAPVGPPTAVNSNASIYGVNFSSVAGGGGTVSVTAIQAFITNGTIPSGLTLGMMKSNVKAITPGEATFDQTLYNQYTAATTLYNQDLAAYNALLTTYNAALAVYNAAQTQYQTDVATYNRIIANNARDPGFLAAVQQFAAQMVTQNGYFMPTQQLGSFTSFLVNFGKIMQDTTTLAGMNAGKAIILNDIFELASSMVGVLQKIAAAQANYLNLLTKIQKAYTDKINQIHIFLTGESGVNTNISAADSGSGTIKQGYRSELNSANSSYQQAATANQQIISDQSKALQSNINQTNSAVTSQNDLITAIIQQLSTILSSITK